MYAFQGLQAEAFQSFEQAINTFEQMSDRDAVGKEIQQTQLYKVVALMDAQDNDAAEQVYMLANQSMKQSGQKAIERLACSGSAHRFMHYLLLRLLVGQPDLLEERQAYLAQSTEWKQDLGHPWMLINAYRAWLLQGHQQADLASEYMQAAVDNCFEGGGEMLNWMGHCLLAFGHSLQLTLSTCAIVAAPASCYPLITLKELAQASTEAARLAALSKALPFNFH